MAIRITHLDGPLAGKVESFGDDKERILVGRVSADCDVRFPDDYTVISREHLVLVEGPGIYRLDVSTTKPVFVDGVEALQDQEIRGTVEMQLGGPDGPHLRLEVNPDAMGPATVKRTEMRDVHDRVRGTRRLTTVVGAGVLLVAAAVVGGYFWFQEQTVNLAAFFEAEARKAGGGNVPAAVLQQARDSVYLVIASDASGESGMGTSWVVGNGVLATNSHVAEIMNELQPGQELQVRSPVEPFTTHTVQRVELHPGYLRFQEVVGAFDPVVKALGQSVLDAGLIGGYDVALMYVDQPEKLAKSLTIAAQEDLVKLDAGEAVAYIGYPMENMVLSSLARMPTPQSKVGNLTAVTDYFNIRRKDGVNQLVQFDIGATGGASGSPVINTKGEVVAVLSSVNFIFLNDGEIRIPSGASINFGQRADLVQELLDGTAADRLRDYETQWKESLQLFTDFHSVLPDLLVSDVKSWLETEADPIVLKEEAGKTGPMSEDWGGHIARYGLSLPEPGVYAFWAISDGRDNIDVAVVQNGEVVLWDQEPNWFPMVIGDFYEKTNVQLVVFGPSEGLGFTMKGFYWPHTIVPPPPTN